jgi:hypothetical protein
MKNIHVLPTDKPSRLYNNNGQLHLDSVLTTSNGHTINQHIYITSDEEIKEGVNQWYLDKFTNKPRNSSGSQYGEKQDVIILTTDPSLAPDVQKIDDEFLEWFVKNPSCESVKVEDYGNFYNFRYLILIPQETLSTKLHIGEVVDESYPEAFRKQETLEDAAKRTYQKGLQDDIDLSFYDGVRLGSEWQQERSYSEEEVLSILNDFIGENPIDVDRWFEQFKTK